MNECYCDYLPDGIICETCENEFFNIEIEEFTP